MNDEDIFSRWSRRKRAVVEEPETDPEDRETVDDNADPEDEEKLLERLGLPVPESLKPGDDFSRFMAPSVPGFLQKRALRVLWSSNPVLANLDGLNDYDDDFGSPELTKSVVATGYKVGRGFLKDLVISEDDEIETDVASVTPNISENEASAVSAQTDAKPGPEPETTSAIADSQTSELTPRRMRFET